MQKLLRVALSKALIALGFIIMIGSAIAAPVLVYRFDASVLIAAGACTFFMLVAFLVIRAGDLLAPRLRSGQ